ncbi:hypothetical protein [Aneurinibacillus tyrosinisolvens]|uniref:hypothetical protein n=1 Tax=Aneurinibacillus tyrosinisolvens TaxID=1443435 RepID=UPI00063EFD2B|nr:hypothetical protein [Aneurinibacillus tyrosinisolvens]
MNLSLNHEVLADFCLFYAQVEVAAGREELISKTLSMKEVQLELEKLKSQLKDDSMSLFMKRDYTDYLCLDFGPVFNIPYEWYGEKSGPPFVFEIPKKMWELVSDYVSELTEEETIEPKGESYYKDFKDRFYSGCYEILTSLWREYKLTETGAMLYMYYSAKEMYEAVAETLITHTLSPFRLHVYNKEIKRRVQVAMPLFEKITTQIKFGRLDSFLPFDEQLFFTVIYAWAKINEEVEEPHYIPEDCDFAERIIWQLEANSAKKEEEPLFPLSHSVKSVIIIEDLVGEKEEESGNPLN